MKHVLVVAHPKAASFTHSVARTYSEAALAAGHEACVRDLYAMGFQPCLQADEIPSTKDFTPRDDVRAERALLAGAGVFAFFYPLWLNAPPAILKGYLDRVFGPGFAYGAGPSGTEQRLSGRSMISFTSSGAPGTWVHKSGAWDALQKLFDEHFAAVTGLTVLDHVHFGYVVPGMRADAVERMLESVRTTFARHFRTGQPPAA